MSDDDDGSPKMDGAAFEPALELELKEYDWASRPAPAEVSLEELKQALAVLAVLGMDEDEQPVWVH